MKQELSRDGHRQRAKQQYVLNGIENLPDHNILELILFYAIPRRDVKDTAYALMNRFDGDISRVFRADIDELKEVDGIGENAAILISLFNDVSKLLTKSKNKEVKVLREYEESKEYVKNSLSELTNERVLAITLNNSCEIISCHTVSNGTVNCSAVEPKKIVEFAIKDNASYVILAHNHPSGSYMPSQNDVEFTKFISSTLKAINITLKDHIIVGDNGALSMNNDSRFISCFM